MPSYPDEPDILLPRFGKQPRRVNRFLVTLGLLFFAFLVLQNAVPLYTDWMWFKEVGYRNVFSTIILAKTLLFFLLGGTFFAIFYFNLRHARRLAPETTDRFLMQNFGPQWGNTLQRGIGWILVIVALFFSLWAGRVAAEYWASYLEFMNWTPFGVKDPVFGNDVGFYVFRLPLLRFLWQFVFTTLIITTLAVVAFHYADRAIETLSGLPDVAPRVKSQLLALLAALAVVRAAGYRLNAYDLLIKENGVFTGAGYTDVHYRLLALNVETLLLCLTAAACLFAIWNVRAIRLAVYGAVGWLAAVVLLGAVLPGTMEKVYVEPNQREAEQEYIARNIKFTRQGFGVENVRRIDNFPADDSLTAAGLKANADTLDNVRLWDYDFLSKLYDQLQTVKTYYKFKQDTLNGTLAHNIDIDRYPVGGKLRQVMLAPREMDASVTPSWQNQRLEYTHGYGIVMSPVNRIVQAGPDYFIQGLPPATSAEAQNLQVKQPEIYYGMLNHEYVFVDTTRQEFDYPATGATGSSNGDHFTTYHGKGGIRIGDSPLAKLAFSLRLGDPNVLLSKGFKDSTRVLFRRDIRERVQTVAPFVQQDGDPYIVLNPDDGRLIWVVDCYTLTSRYPYSTPFNMPVSDDVSNQSNYIRNSIKATVDAYDGSVNLYLVDTKDPIAHTYGKIFPGLLKPFSAMPDGLRAHLRYPEDLFRIQRSIYATYHVNDPRTFYSKEDAWAIPLEPNNDPNATALSGQQQMEPYYVIMRLPDGTDGAGAPALKEEFLLMSPLSPYRREKENILGWMCARCDGDHYGDLVLYSFPQRASVNGPSQVVALANSDKAISAQLTLWRQGGSDARFGNLLVIPVQKSLLYIMPIYVFATANPLPQLQKVVVIYGKTIVMEDTLEKALARVFTDYTAPDTGAPATPDNSPQAGGPPSNIPPQIRALVGEAARQYDDAQQKLKSGDFAAYGAAMKEVEATLKKLRSAVER